MLNYYKNIHNFNCLEPYNSKTVRFIQAVAIRLLFNPVPATYRIFSTSSPGCLFNQATDFWAVITSYF